MRSHRLFAGVRRIVSALERVLLSQHVVEHHPARELSTIDEEAFAWGKLQAKTETTLAALDEFGI